MTTPQERMKARLETARLPYKEIRCYGSQIVVTAWSRAAAEKWATLLATFCTVRGVRESLDTNKVNMNTMLRPTCHKVWLVFAVV